MLEAERKRKDEERMERLKEERQQQLEEQRRREEERLEAMRRREEEVRRRGEWFGLNLLRILKNFLVGAVKNRLESFFYPCTEFML